MASVQGLERLAADALMVLLHLAAALGHIREGETAAAASVLTDLSRARPAGSATPYAAEALYWRGRLAEEEGGREALRSAARDYATLLSVLPEGRRRGEVRVRLAALSEPGRVLGPEEARLASVRNLRRIGLALHAYAADNGGALPGALFDLVGEYVTDPSLLVRPGGRELPPGTAGGGRIYGYTPGLSAGALRPPGARPGAAWTIPAVVTEPAPGGARLVLGLDGAVRSVQEKGANAAGGDRPAVRAELREREPAP